MKAQENNHGFALVVVIVVMLLATFLAAQLILRVRTELKVAYNVRMRAEGLYLAEAGINLALFRLMDKPIDMDNALNKDKPDKGKTINDDDHFNQGNMYETTLAGGGIRYYAVNEAGKIDLNALQPQLLRLFLEYHGLEPDQIDTVLDSLQDWTDADDMHRLSGAEKDYYQGLDPPYAPRDKPIEEPAEFFLIKGTDALAGKFAAAEVFTVYNKSRRLDFNSLTPAMLDFLVQGDAEKKAAYTESQQLFGTLNAANAREVLGEDRFAELSPYLTYSAGSNPYYFIVAEGKKGYDPGEEQQGWDKDSTPGTRVSALMLIQKPRYQYLAWQEDQT